MNIRLRLRLVRKDGLMSNIIKKWFISKIKLVAIFQIIYRNTEFVFYSTFIRNRNTHIHIGKYLYVTQLEL
jgi:hypothetical protein